MGRSIVIPFRFSMEITHKYEEFVEKDASKEIYKVTYDFFKNKLKCSESDARKYAQEVKKIWKPGNIRVNIPLEFRV